MARPTDEWIGKHDAQAIPVRVQLRVVADNNGRCADCGNKVGAAIGLPVEMDHIKALVLGGKHRQSNLQPLCRPCHAKKTKSDVAAKSVTARVQAKHLGIKQPKRNPMPGSKGSRWKKKVDGTVVDRWAT